MLSASVHSCLDHVVLACVCHQKSIMAAFKESGLSLRERPTATQYQKIKKNTQYQKIKKKSNVSIKSLYNLKIYYKGNWWDILIRFVLCIQQLSKLLITLHLCISGILLLKVVLLNESLTFPDWWIEKDGQFPGIH